MDGGDDDQRNERTTSPKNVCWLYYMYLSVVVVFWLTIKGTRGQHRLRTYVGYTNCLLFFGGVVISLVSHMLAMAEG